MDLSLVIYAIVGVLVLVIGVQAVRRFWSGDTEGETASDPEPKSSPLRLQVGELKDGRPAHQPHQALSVLNMRGFIEAEMEREMLKTLELESLPEELRDTLVGSGVEVVAVRCLDKLLDNLVEDDKDNLLKLIEAEDAERIHLLLRRRRVDLVDIVGDEMSKFLEESRRRFT